MHRVRIFEGVSSVSGLLGESEEVDSLRSLSLVRLESLEDSNSISGGIGLEEVPATTVELAVSSSAGESREVRFFSGTTTSSFEEAPKDPFSEVRR